LNQLLLVLLLSLALLPLLLQELLLLLLEREQGWQLGWSPQLLLLLVLPLLHPRHCCPYPPLE
jgi:hypothetical protein